MKLDNTNCDKTQKLKLWQNYENSLWQLNSNCDSSNSDGSDSSSSDQWWPKPGKQGTNKTEQILVNLDETKRTGQNGQNWAKPGKKWEFSCENVENGAKNGRNWEKPVKKWAKTVKKRANKTESWQNRAKPKVSPNLGSGLVIPVLETKNWWNFLTPKKETNENNGEGSWLWLSLRRLITIYLETSLS